ncbi:TPA: hydrolase, partial [Candidatus Gastranaerophilales bacterium HUM_20]
MMQAGAVPVTWMQVLCELQRDWAREVTYDGAMEIIKKHSGAFGSGVFYAETFCK